MVSDRFVSSNAPNKEEAAVTIARKKKLISCKPLRGVEGFE